MRKSGTNPTFNAAALPLLLNVPDKENPCLYYILGFVEIHSHIFTIFSCILAVRWKATPEEANATPSRKGNHGPPAKADVIHVHGLTPSSNILQRRAHACSRRRCRYTNICRLGHHSWTSCLLCPVVRSYNSAQEPHSQPGLA